MSYDSLNVDLKNVQKAQIEILDEVDRICKENEIKYQLFAGSLLGSIRHRGFIPWDDDIDICMLRDDYEKFISITKKELSSRYFLQTTETDKDFYMKFAKVRKNNTLFLESSLSELNIHHGIYIDIFPLDNVKPCEFKGKVQQKMLYILGRLQLLRVKKHCLNTNSVLTKMFRLFGHYLIKLLPSQILNIIHEKVLRMFSKDDCEYVSHLTNGTPKSKYLKYLMKKDEVNDTFFQIFENKKYPIPKNYDAVLSNIYGEYEKLPPKEMQKPHHGIIDIRL